MYHVSLSHRHPFAINHWRMWRCLTLAAIENISLQVHQLGSNHILTYNQCNFIDMSKLEVMLKWYTWNHRHKCLTKRSLKLHTRTAALVVLGRLRPIDSKSLKIVQLIKNMIHLIQLPFCLLRQFTLRCSVLYSLLSIYLAYLRSIMGHICFGIAILLSVVLM